jgi:hypothetical protein
MGPIGVQKSDSPRRRLLNICSADRQAVRALQSRASRRDSMHRITALSPGERVPALCRRVRGYLGL